MKSQVVKRSIVIADAQDKRELGRCVLERSERDCGRQPKHWRCRISFLRSIRSARHGNLSSALRLFVLDHYSLPGNREHCS